MKQYLPLGKFSFGMGDRFGHQGKAQLRACLLAAELGVDVVPVWNKANREHNFIGTEPASLRAEADAAVQTLGWRPSLETDISTRSKSMRGSLPGTSLKICLRGTLSHCFKTLRLEIKSIS